MDWQDSHKYNTYTDWAREQAGEKAGKIRDNKLEKYYNMDFGKESMEHKLQFVGTKKKVQKCIDKISSKDEMEWSVDIYIKKSLPYTWEKKVKKTHW